MFLKSELHTSGTLLVLFGVANKQRISNKYYRDSTFSTALLCNKQRTLYHMYSILYCIGNYSKTVHVCEMRAMCAFNTRIKARNAFGRSSYWKIFRISKTFICCFSFTCLSIDTSFNKNDTATRHHLQVL